MSGHVDFYGLLEFISQIRLQVIIVCLVLPVPIVRRTAALGLAPPAKSSKKPLRMASSFDCASSAPTSFGRSTLPAPATSIVLSERDTKSYVPLSSSCSLALAFVAASSIVQGPRSDTTLISASSQKRFQRASVTSSSLGVCSG